MFGLFLLTGTFDGAAGGLIDAIKLYLLFGVP